MSRCCDGCTDDWCCFCADSNEFCPEDDDHAQLEESEDTPKFQGFRGGAVAYVDEVSYMQRKQAEKELQDRLLATKEQGPYLVPKLNDKTLLMNHESAAQYHCNTCKGLYLVKYNPYQTDEVLKIVECLCA